MLVPDQGIERQGGSATGGGAVSSLEAVDILVESGVRATRSDAAAWLIHAGIEANTAMFTSVYETVVEIRRLREVACNQAQQAMRPDGAFPASKLSRDEGAQPIRPEPPRP